MPPPAGINIPNGCCLKILQSLNGPKQAPKNWHNMLKESIRSMGYQRALKISACLCTKGAGNQLNIILVYVDDIIVLSTDDVHIDEMVTAYKTSMQCETWVTSSTII